MTSRPRSLPRPALLALAVTSALCLAAPLAQAAPAADAGAPARSDAQTLDELVVEGHTVKTAASPKYTQPLLDTPQTVTQIPTEVIEGQNLLGLRDILATLPGITFGAGEGGGGYGDSINLRGFSANNDITVDGIRDSAQYTRSDTFNLETVEVINGANSVNSGAGAVGGTINLVSKVANDQDFTRAQLGAGTDSYGRATVDSNTTFGENSALRINAMVHRNDIPGRDVEENERWGIAPSVAFGLGTDTVLSLSYLHQEDDNVPQYGVPYYGGGPIPGVDPSDYFGYRNVDTQEIEVDAFTAKIDHSFSENFSVSNVTRQSTTTQFSRVNPPQGTYCLPSNVSASGGSCSVNVSAFPDNPIVVPPGFYYPGGPRGNTRDSENQIAINQTDFLSTFLAGGIEHDLVTGFSISHETYDLRSGSSLRNPDGSAITFPNPDPNGPPLSYPFMDYGNPDSIWTGPVNFIPTTKQTGELDNRALYALDTMKFNDALHLNLGVRYERNEGTHRTDSIAIPADGGAVTPGVEAQINDDLLSYRGGLVFKPADNGTIYLSYGNSETPSKASVNGACNPDTTCNVDPESAVITELGTKWDLYGGALSLTAAVFRNERENYKVPDANNPDNPSGEQQLDGSARVDGLLLGAVGRVSENWYVYANYSRLDSEVLQGVSDTDAALGSDFARGDRLTNTPQDSASLWTTYDISSQWQVGYGVTYLGRVWLTQHNANNPDGPLVTAPGYTTHRAMVNWRATQQISLQLNATNLFDKEYYTRPRNNGWSTPGEARSVVLTANYMF